MRLCGASPVGINTTSVRSSCQSASWASARWPRCGGLKAEPRTPMPPRSPPAPGALLTHLAVAADGVLVGGQLAQADRAAGVQLLGRVADLRPHAELEAVGKAGRGVGV